MTEFNLSKYRTEFVGMMFYEERIVKEFIKKENMLLNLLWKKKISWVEFWKRRKKLAGDDLI